MMLVRWKEAAASRKGETTPDAWNLAARQWVLARWKWDTEAQTGERWEELIAILGSAVLLDAGAKSTALEGLALLGGSRSNRSHFWCGVFGGVAEALDLKQELREVFDTVIDVSDAAELSKLGAKVLSETAAKVLSTGADAVTGVAPIRIALGMLVALFCPDPTNCPSGSAAAWSTLAEIPGG